MFANASFDQFDTGGFALSNARLFRALKLLPPSALRSGLFGVTWAETWLRWPLATLRRTDRMDATLTAVDPTGERFGLDSSVKRRIKRNVLYNLLPDLFATLGALGRDDIRGSVQKTVAADVLDRECEAGPGAIVAGFRTGPYSVTPWALAAAVPGRQVLMIVSWEALARMGEQLNQAFMGSLAQRVSFVSADDSRVLARALAVLKAGGVVATLLELSPVSFARKTTVDFLDWRIEVPYGISYLSAATRRRVIPATLTRLKGTRFRLRIREPLNAPARGDQEAIKAQTQQLYGQLERHLLRVPDQWIGWLLLESHMGIQLSRSGGPAISAQS